MCITYDTPPPSVLFQHRRLTTARYLTDHGIPCVLWGEDALAFVHNVPSELFTQQLPAPDALVPFAVRLLQDEFQYRRTLQQYDIFDPSKDREDPWPDVRVVRLKHEGNSRIAEFVSIVPQSYFSIDAESSPEDFVSLCLLLTPSTLASACLDGTSFLRNSYTPACSQNQAE